MQVAGVYARFTWAMMYKGRISLPRFRPRVSRGLATSKSSTVRHGVPFETVFVFVSAGTFALLSNWHVYWPTLLIFPNQGADSFGSMMNKGKLVRDKTDQFSWLKNRVSIYLQPRLVISPTI